MPFVHPAQEPGNEAYHQEFLRGLTHKLNNLLAIIQGFSSLTLMGEDLDPAALENMQHIREAGKNIAHLNERVRIAGGCAGTNLQPLHLHEYFKSLNTELREPFANAGITFEIRAAENLPPVMADPVKLKDLLLEILRNAAEAPSKNGGSALLKASQTSGGESCVDILVSNTGSDIAPEKASEIFRPFYGTKNNGHFGLGLTIAVMLARQMNCRISVNPESNTVTFKVAVPVA